MEDDVDVDVKRMCVLSGQGLVGLASNAWGRLRQGRRDETRQGRTDYGGPIFCVADVIRHLMVGKARQGARCQRQRIPWCASYS
jgi:hypothetical protein